MIQPQPAMQIAVPASDGCVDFGTVDELNARDELALQELEARLDDQDDPNRLVWLRQLGKTLEFLGKTYWMRNASHIVSARSAHRSYPSYNGARIEWGEDRLVVRWLRGSGPNHGLFVRGDNHSFVCDQRWLMGMHGEPRSFDVSRDCYAKTFRREALLADDVMVEFTSDDFLDAAVERWLARAPAYMIRPALPSVPPSRDDVMTPWSTPLALQEALGFGSDVDSIRVEVIEENFAGVQLRLRTMDGEQIGFLAAPCVDPRLRMDGSLWYGLIRRHEVGPGEHQQLLVSGPLWRDDSQRRRAQGLGRDLAEALYLRR